MKMKWLNFLNFIRYDDHRVPTRDLFEPVREQMALHKKFSIPATWLMQVDAMLLGPYVEFFKRNCPADHELGLWFEINRAHCDYAGVKFNGRAGINWDHHSNASLSIGYTPADRFKLADAAMECFFKGFGYYPSTVAAWYMDAVTLDHLQRKYGITASANCRDQWGTDGYSLWGGFWGGAYYPSLNNAFIPGASEKKQIPIPVFRLLGSCPMDQYASDIGGNGQGVCTLEPVDKWGQDVGWLDSFTVNMYGNVPFEYSFAQTGQENSFGWPRIRHGYELQIERFARLKDNGEILCGTMKEAASWYKDNFAVTAPCAVVATRDVLGKGRKAIWFNSRFYRAGVLVENDRLLIRDIHLFRSDYQDRYQDATCDNHAMVVDSLPLVEGFLWRKDRPEASAYFEVDRNGVWEQIQCGELAVMADEEAHTLTLELAGILKLGFSEIGLAISGQTGAFRLVMPKEHKLNPVVANGALECLHNDFRYRISVKGASQMGDNGEAILLECASGVLELGMDDCW